MITTLSLSDESKLIWKEIFDQSALQVPFLTYEWHSIYFATDGKHEEPLIFHLPNVSMIAAFSKKNAQASFVGPEITDYSDLIGPEENKAEAWNELIPELNRRGMTSLSLTNIPESSNTYKYFVELSKKNSTITITQRDITPRIHPLPASYDEYLANLSRKNRHELERKQRKFLREFPNVCICTKLGKDADMDTIISLMKLDERKLDFLTSDHEAFFQALPSAFSDSLITMILYVNEIPATAIVAFQTPTAFLLYNSGFDHTNFSGGGFYLKAQSIHYAISHKLNEYNFLRGGERYKHNLGGKDYPVFDISVSNLT